MASRLWRDGFREHEIVLAWGPAYRYVSVTRRDDGRHLVEGEILPPTG